MSQEEIQGIKSLRLRRHLVATHPPQKHNSGENSKAELFLFGVSLFWRGRMMWVLFARRTFQHMYLICSSDDKPQTLLLSSSGQFITLCYQQVYAPKENKKYKRTSFESESSFGEENVGRRDFNSHTFLLTFASSLSFFFRAFRAFFSAGGAWKKQTTEHFQKLQFTPLSGIGR